MGKDKKEKEEKTKNSDFVFIPGTNTATCTGPLNVQCPSGGQWSLSVGTCVMFKPGK